MRLTRDAAKIVDSLLNNLGVCVVVTVAEDLVMRDSCLDVLGRGCVELEVRVDFEGLGVHLFHGSVEYLELPRRGFKFSS